MNSCDFHLLAQIQETVTGSDVHQVAQHLTAYTSACALIEAVTLGAEGDLDLLIVIRDRHERILRSYVHTHDIHDSKERIARLEAYATLVVA